jgi:hypothetical protein
LIARVAISERSISQGTARAALRLSFNTTEINVAAHSISMLKHRESLARVRHKAAAPADALIRTGSMTILGALLGYMESTDKLPKGFFSNDKGEPMIPTKVALAAGAHLVAAFSHGTTHKVASVAGDTFAACYGYAAGSHHAIVAGR